MVNAVGEHGDGTPIVATSRTYTTVAGSSRTYGQGFAAVAWPEDGALSDSERILTDVEVSDAFRTNLGVASWTDAMVRVRVDLQDAAGNVVDQRDHWVPPYGHIQWRLEKGVTGGTAAVYIMDGPSGAVVYPYASVVNWATGDGVDIEAHLTAVGLSAQSLSARAARRANPAAAPVPGFSLSSLGRRITPLAAVAR